MTEEAVAQVVEVGGKASMTKEVVAEAMEYVRLTADFIGDQAPLLVQEVLRFGLIDNLVFMVIWLIPALVAGYGLYKAIKAFDFDDGSDVAVCFILSAFASGCAALSFCAARVAVKITFAPRLYLIQAFADLV